MNYTELSQAITDFLQDDETSFQNNKDLFIRLGEKRVFATLKLPMVRENATASTTADNRFLSIPTNVLSVLSLQLTSGTSVTSLLQKDMDFIREAYPNPSSTGVPAVYAVYDADSLLLGPTPAAAYVVEMAYHKMPTSIVDAATTWLGDNLDRLLLYAVLVEGYTYMKGDADLLQVYENGFREELEKASAIVSRGAYNGGEYRMGAA